MVFPSELTKGSRSSALSFSSVIGVGASIWIVCAFHASRHVDAMIGPVGQRRVDPGRGRRVDPAGGLTAG